jgi:hypothetical protein
MGRPVPVATFDRIKSELTDRLGGVTAFLRSPGAWKPAEGSVVHDQVAIWGVMVSDVIPLGCAAIERLWKSSWSKNASLPGFTR